MPALLIPGLVFFGAVVLLALAQTANVHVKAQTEAQQSFWGFLGDALTGRSTVNAITKATRSALSRWALSQMRPVAAWFAAINTLVRDVFRTQTQTLNTVADSFERLRHTTIPREAGKAAAPAKAQAKTATRAAHKAQASAASTSTSLHRYRVTTRPKIAHATHAVDVTIPQQLGRVRTRTTTLGREYDDLRGRTKALEDGAVHTWRWLRSHPLSATMGVFAGAVAVALSRLGFGFLRCRSWQRLGKSLTCREADNLGALLGLVGTVALVSEFRELVKIAQAVEHETAVGIQDLAGL